MLTATDRITGNRVTIVDKGPVERTVIIRHPDGTTQVQFVQLLRNILKGERQ